MKNMRMCKRLFCLIFAIVIMFGSFDFSNIQVQANPMDSGIEMSDEESVVSDNDYVEQPERMEEIEANAASASTIILNGASKKVAGKINASSEVVKLSAADGEKVYELTNLTPGVCYAFDLTLQTLGGFCDYNTSRSFYVSIWEGKIKDGTSNEFISTSSYAKPYAVVKEGYKYYAELKPYTYDSNYYIHFDLNEIPEIESVSFPFDKVTVYQGLFPYDSGNYYRIITDQIAKKGASFVLKAKDGGQGATKTTYDLAEFSVADAYYYSAIIDPVSGEWKKGNSAGCPYNATNVGSLAPGNYVLEVQTCYYATTGSKYYIPVEIKSRNDLVNAYYEDDNESIVSTEIALANFKNTGEYSYFAADLTANETYYLNNSAQGAAYFTVRDSSGALVRNTESQLLLNSNVMESFKVKTSGTYYFTVWDTQAINNTLKLSGPVSAKKATKIKVGDTFEIDGKEVVLAGTVKAGDTVNFTNSEEQFYELTDITYGLGYQCAAINGSGGVSKYTALEIYEGKTVEDSNGKKYFKIKSKDKHFYPSSSYKYYIKFQKRLYGDNVYSVLSNKKPVSISCNFNTVLYDDMKLYDNDTFYTILDGCMQKKGATVTFEDGTKQKSYNLGEFGPEILSIYKENGEPLYLSGQIKAGKYELRYSSPLNFSFTYTVKPKSDIPLVFSKDAQGVITNKEFSLDDWSNTGVYTVVKAKLEEGESYKISVVGDNYVNGCCFYSMRNKNGVLVSDSAGTIERRSANTPFSVKEDGTYYFVIYDYRNTGIGCRIDEVITKKVSNMELSSYYEYQKVFYRYLSTDKSNYRIAYNANPTFKVTYEDGTFEFISYMDGSSKIILDDIIKADESKAAKDLDDCDPGDYYGVFKIPGYSKSVRVPFTVKDAYEVPNDISPGETKQTGRFKYPAYSFSIKTDCYKLEMEEGQSYRITAQGATIAIRDTDGNMLGDGQGVAVVSSKKAMTAYVIIRTYGDDIAVSCVKTKGVESARIVTQPHCLSYWKELDFPTDDGLEIEILFTDGSKEVVDVEGLESYLSYEKGVESTEIYTDRYGYEHERCKEGTYEFAYKIAGYNKILTTDSYTVKKLSSTTIEPSDVVAVSKASDSYLGKVYKIRLIKGCRYLVENDCYGRFAIYDDGGNDLGYQYDFSMRKHIGNTVFVPEYTGDYYIRVSADANSSMCVTKVDKAASAELVDQPYGTDEEPYCVGLGDLMPWGAKIRITLQDDTAEEFVCNDENWDKYVKEVMIYQEDNLVSEPMPYGKYRCEIVLYDLDGDGDNIVLTTDEFTQKWGIWDQLDNVLDDGDNLENIKTWNHYAYVKLNTESDKKYKICVDNPAAELKLFYIEDGKLYTHDSDPDNISRETSAEYIFRAVEGREYIIQLATTDEQIIKSTKISFFEIKEIASVALCGDNPSTYEIDYAKETYPDGIKLDITYVGDEEPKCVTIRNDNCIYTSSGTKYTPSVNVSILSGDKLTIANKDENGFYPASNWGETYYFKISIKEPMQTAGDRNYVFVPLKINGAGKDYSINYNSNIEKVRATCENAIVTGEMLNRTVEKNKVARLLPNAYAIKGYTFVGWTSDAAAPAICGENVSVDDLKEASPDVFFAPEEEIVNLSKDGSTVELYAIWKETIYTITYHMGNAKFAEGMEPAQSYTYNSDEIYMPKINNEDGSLNTEILQSNSVRGYSFAGFYKDAACKNPITKIDRYSTGNVNIFAKWKPKTYTVNFYGNGGTALSDVYRQNIPYGVATKLNSNKYQMKDYAFVGWATEPTALEDVNADNYEDVVVCQNKEALVLNASNIDIFDLDDDCVIDLYAVWTNWFHIAYDFDGDKIASDPYYGEGVSEKGEILVAEGTHPDNYLYKTELIFDTKPVRKGYTFAGWYKDPNYKNKVTGISRKTFGNQKIYAKWNANNYTLVFKPNGGSGKMSSIKTYCYDGFAPDEKKIDVILPECKFKKKGHSFAGWKIVVGDTAYTYQPGEKVHNLTYIKGKKVSVTALWTLDTYDVHFITNGGTIDDSGELYEELNGYRAYYQYDSENSPITLPTPSMDGFEFRGWYTDKTYQKRVKSLKSSTGTRNLYAKWARAYTVCYDANGGDGEMADKAGNMDTEIVLKNKFTKSGYAFMGWTTIEPGSSEWTEAVAIADMNGRSAYTELVQYKNKYALMSPDLSNLTIEDGTYKLKLYAVWEKDFKVVFDPKCKDAELVNVVGEEEVDSYTYGQGVASLPKPVRTGYSFKGWYSDSACKNIVSAVSTTASGDKTLYAGWKSLSYSITYKANAPEGTKASGTMKTQKMSYNVGKKLTKSAFKIKGYRFMGWSTTPNGPVQYLDAQNVYKMNGSFKKQTTLYAIWAKNVYTFSYDLNNGEKIEALATDPDDVYYKESENGNSYMVRYSIGTKMMPADIMVPERMGYSFAGWYKNPSYKTKFEGMKASETGNRTIYAKWKSNQ